MGVVGSIGQESFFGRKTTMDLPEELPVEVRIFVLWLASIMRKRNDSAVARAAGG